MRVSSRPGAWGALALLVFVTNCVKAVERHYYIAAVNINWDYGAKGNQRDGPTYRKAVYREYEPGFQKAKTHPSWSGLLGPTLRGQEGDTIIVTFRNMADHPCSIHPHGIAYGKQSEGSLYFDNTSDFEKEDDVIHPGKEHTYNWEVTSDVAPKTADPFCVTYTYFSHHDFVKDYNTGLIGTLLICKKDSLNDAGNQVHFQKEFVLLFGVFDEKYSWYSRGGPPLTENVKYTINGFTNGSIPDLTVCAHSKVSWHILGMSTEPELFSVHFNGQVLQQHGHKVSSVGIISGTATSAEMVAVQAGRWLLSSHISKHLEEGLHGFLTINMCEEFPAPKRKITIQQSRESQEWTYYIAAEEIIWDYAPNLPNNVDGDFRATYLKQSAERIGKKYKKAVFTQYKDESFKERAENKQRKKEVGILGPVIRAQIRDVIKIVFKNKASRPYSIYPHGLTIDKNNEGANYPDGGNQSHAVQPGETYTYVWQVIEEDEPLQNDSRCLTRMYHSAVNTPRDIASGLVGPLLICKSQSLNTRNVQLRSDKEQHAMFAVFDENKSWYLDENINTYCGDSKRVKKDDPEFYKSNVMHTINGYVYESGQVLGFCNGEIVTWHVSSVGEQNGIQTATFYGHTFELNNREEDILSLFPMTGETISMNMANDGIWLLASLNTHETTKGVRLKFKDVECFRDYVAEYDEYNDSKVSFSVWIPADETKTHEEVGIPPPLKLADDSETDFYAEILGLRTFSSLGNSTTEMEELDLSFLDHDEGVLPEEISPSHADKILNITVSKLELFKQNHSDSILSDFNDENRTSNGIQNETLSGFSVTDAIMSNSTFGNGTTDMDLDEDVLLEDSGLSRSYEIQNKNPKLEHFQVNQSDLILSAGFDDEKLKSKGAPNDTLLSFSVTDAVMLNNSGNSTIDMEELDLSSLGIYEGVLLEGNSSGIAEIHNTTYLELEHSRPTQADLMLSDFDDENHTSKGVQNDTLLSFSIVDTMEYSNSENRTTDMEKLDPSFLDQDESVLLEDYSLSVTGEIQNTNYPQLEQFKQNQADLTLSEVFDDENRTLEDVQNKTLFVLVPDAITPNTSLFNESSGSSTNSSDIPVLQDTDRDYTTPNGHNASLIAKEAMSLQSTPTPKGHEENTTEAFTVDMFNYSEPATESPTNFTDVQALEEFVLLEGSDQMKTMSKVHEVEYNISPPALANNITQELLGNTTQSIIDDAVQKVNRTKVSYKLLNETVKELNSTQVDSESTLDKLPKLSTQLSKSDGILLPNSSSEEFSEEVVIHLKNSNNTEVILTSPLNPQTEHWSYDGKYELVPIEISDHTKKYITDEPGPQPNKTSETKKEKKTVLKRISPMKGYGMKTKKRVEYKPQPRSALTPKGFSPRGFGPAGLTPRGTRPVSSEENLLGKSIIIGVPRNEFNDYELYVPQQGQDYDFESIPDHTEEYEYVEYKDPYRKQGDVQSVILDEASKYSLQMAGSKSRAYFITAEEVDWDYAGYGQRREDKASQKARPTKFKKVVFREYLDVSFTTPYIRGEVDEHLGILGPVIKAEVDETIYIVFRNLANRPYSLHANGVSYGKNMEGLKYEDESPYWYRQDDAVQPNTTFIYMWTVNAKVGPHQSESDCRIWAYYSAVNPERDIHSGLIGPLMVCRKGTLDNNPIDTREFVLLFMTFDENKSWYYETNRKILEQTNREAVMDPEFNNNIRFHAINGIIYSLKGLRMYTKQLVKWHLINMGSPMDFHSIHFHGQTFLNKNTRDQRQGVYPLLPGGFATLEMFPSKPGLWLLESEIGISQQRGMQTLFLVLDNVCEHPLGLTNGIVKDSQITASDSRSYWLPSLARLHNAGKYNAWSTTKAGEWIQVDFQRPVVISKVATQGAKQVFTSHFVLNYTISYSTDRKRWIFYKGDSKASRKTFEGNTEAHKVKENVFFPPLIGRYVRLYPSHSYNYPTVRMEFYGCELDGCSVPLGIKNGFVRDDQITASSFATSWYSGSWDPWLARLDKTGAVNAWQAKSSDMQPWIQIDLKMVKKITGIVTQGAKSLHKEMFVTAYELEYSDDSKKWTKYTDDEDYEQKIFMGNSDNNGHMRNYIYPPIFSRFVRIIPKRWQNSVTLRIELLGCDFE